MVSAHAIYKYARISPLRARQVLNVIRNKSAEEALYQLKVMNKKAALPIINTLKSAIANAEQKGADVSKLYIVKAVADEGPRFRKWMPRAHGRATIMKKRTSHITIVVAEQEEN